MKRLIAISLSIFLLAGCFKNKEQNAHDSPVLISGSVQLTGNKQQDIEAIQKVLNASKLTEADKSSEYQKLISLVDYGHTSKQEIKKKADRINGSTDDVSPCIVEYASARTAGFVLLYGPGNTVYSCVLNQFVFPSASTVGFSHCITRVASSMGSAGGILPFGLTTTFSLGMQTWTGGGFCQN